MTIDKKYYDALIKLSIDKTDTNGSTIEEICYLVDNDMVIGSHKVGEALPSYIITPVGNSVVKDEANKYPEIK